MSTESIAVAVFLLVVFGLVTYARERTQARTEAAYKGVFDSLTEENRELRDRWYMSKGLPVSGVDVRKQAEEKRERAQQRRESAVTGPTGGPLKAVQAGLAAAEGQRKPE